MSEPTIRLHIVGSGCPDARATRYGSAFVLDAGPDKALIDCGPATTWKLAKMGMHPLDIEHVLFTHHHYDHTVDFPCFALTRFDQAKGNEPSLKVYGPPPTRDFVDRLLGPRGAFRVDIDSRLAHPASHACHQMRNGIFPRPPPSLEIHEIDAGPIASATPWSVTACRVKHVEPTMISLAFRFETRVGGVVFAGDCTDCPALRDLARGAHTLVIVCTHFGASEARDPAIGKAIADVVAGLPEVVAVAKDSGVRQVILTHASPNFEQPGRREQMIAAMARDYNGAILFPDELTTIPLNP